MFFVTNFMLMNQLVVMIPRCIIRGDLTTDSSLLVEICSQILFSEPLDDFVLCNKFQLLSLSESVCPA